MSSNSGILDPSMDSIILPGFMTSSVNAFVRYSYSGETYLSDKKSLDEFLVLCEIFKFNVNGIEVTDMKESEEVAVEYESEEGNFVNQTNEMLNTDDDDGIQEEIFETIDDMVVIGDEEHLAEDIEDQSEYEASASGSTRDFDHQNFASMTTTTNLQGTLKDIKSKRLNLIQSEFDLHQGSSSVKDDSFSSENPAKRTRSSKSNS